MKNIQMSGLSPGPEYRQIEQEPQVGSTSSIFKIDVGGYVLLAVSVALLNSSFIQCGVRF